MTKKLEETFNLAPKPDVEMPEVDIKDAIDYAETSSELINALQISEKIDHALATVEDLSEHDDDMDDIATKAIDSYKDLTDLALNIQDAHAGRIYEVAATFLNTALQARDAKVSRKLKTLELQLKKANHDLNVQTKTGQGGPASQGTEFDRNELLAHMTANMTPTKEKK